MRTTAAFLMISMLSPLLAADSDGPPPPGLKPGLKPPPEVALATAKPAVPPKPPDDGPKPTKIGDHRAFPAASLAKGAWLKSKDAPPLWRLAIRSKGAKALRVHFNRFNAETGRVWIHNGKDWFGPYTGRGIYNDGDFWSHIVPGERLVIEFEAGAVPPKLPPFSIEAVSHLTSNPFE